MWISLVTACLTVITGVTVLTLGRWVQTVILDPLTEYRKVVGKIQYNLWHFRNVYDFPWEEAGYTEEDVGDLAKFKRAEARLRHCSGLLVASTNAILGYDLWARAGWVCRPGPRSNTRRSCSTPSPTSVVVRRCFRRCFRVVTGRRLRT